MSRSTASIIINQPLEEIFAFISDYQNDWKWRSSGIDFQKLNDSDPAEFMVTQKYIPLYHHGRNSNLKVIDYSPNQHIVSQILFGKIQMTDERRFFGLEDHSGRFDYSLNIELPGILKIFEQLLTKRLYQDTVNDLLWLKEMLEKLTIPYTNQNILDFRASSAAENNQLLGLT